MNKYHFFFACLLLFSSYTTAQQFDKSILIDMPGDNFAYDVYGAEYMGGNTHVVWINKTDSIYTLYMKKIFPEPGENQVIYSGINKLQNTHISAANVSIIVGWQEKSDDLYRVCLKKIGDIPDTTIYIIDSVYSDPQMSLSGNFVAWINKGDLLLTNLNDTSRSVIKFDSINCSMPSLTPGSGYNYTSLVYLQKDGDDNKVYYGYTDQNTDYYEKKLVSSGVNNKPVYTLEYQIVFEHLQDSIWNVGLGDTYFSPLILKSKFNCRNPYYFSYPMTTKRSGDDVFTPFFFVYDCDSLEENREIIYKTHFYFIDTLMNLSELPGDDTTPKISYVFKNDTPYVAVFWLNENDGRRTIWITKTLYNPLNTAVYIEPDIPEEYSLSSYPNPFNLSAKIEYRITEQGRVNIKVFDMLGAEVALLIDEVKLPGVYNTQLNGSGLTSGIYFIRMETEGRQFVRKIVLMK